MLRITTINVNGIRSAAAKGLYGWLARHKADIVCMQEIKAHELDISAPLKPTAFHAYFNCADKKGYGGVGLLSRTKPRRISCGFGSKEFDPEGRYLQADFDKVSVISVYFPSGSSSEARQQAKFRFLDEFVPALHRLRRSGREVILCGDINIAHKEIDLKNWRSNQKNSGFLPEERAWLSGVLNDLHWVDVFRSLDPRPGQYTFWSTRGQSWAKNVGWRIDYQLTTPAIAQKAVAAAIYKKRRFSDHAPLTIDFDVTL